MSLPIIGWKEILKALKKKGFYPTRQTGSHIIIENGRGVWTAVPRKNEIGKGLLLQIIALRPHKERIFRIIVGFVTFLSVTSYYGKNHQNSWVTESAAQ